MEREALFIIGSYYSFVPGETEKAVGTYQLIASYPLDASAHWRLGDLYERQAEWERAADTLKEAQRVSRAAINDLKSALPPIEYASQTFTEGISCLYHTYIRSQAYIAANDGKAAAVEFQKILDHSGIVWNCLTGALARLGVARANALQAKDSTGAEADAARTRAVAKYQDFLSLWNDADPNIPIYKEAKAEYAILQ